jgi:anti-sigma factor RsiW
MKQCWGEGELRAHLDRELPAEQALAVEQHLTECAACAAAYQALASRAAHVSSWMEDLSADIPAPAPAPNRSSVRPAAWVALAASLLLTALLSRQPARPPVQAVVQPLPAPIPVETPVVATVAAPSPRFRHAPVRPVRPSPVQYYMALDEEPIDTGLVMRVALASGMQADVIVDGDGRARAIRPIQTTLKEYEP